VTPIERLKHREQNQNSKKRGGGGWRGGGGDPPHLGKRHQKHTIDSTTGKAWHVGGEGGGEGDGMIGGRLVATQYKGGGNKGIVANRQKKTVFVRERHREK